jgi:hypothetical protein
MGLMKKPLAAVLLFTVFAGPAVAAKKPKPSHPKVDYTYRPPKFKYKAPKFHNHRSHPQNAHKTQTN